MIQFFILSVVGWGGLQMFLMWLIKTGFGLFLHAMLRRPSWQIKMVHSFGSRSCFAQFAHDGAATLGLGHNIKHVVPPEGLLPLLTDCKVRSGRVARKRWRYFRGWAEDVVYVWQYALSRWCDALKQRRRRRRVLQTLTSQAKLVKRQSAEKVYSWPRLRKSKKSRLEADDDHLYL